MTYEILNDKIITNIDGKNFFISERDSESKGFNGNNSIKINDCKYNLTVDSPELKQLLDYQTDKDIAGIIGTDIISETGISLNFETKEIIFNSENTNGLNGISVYSDEHKHFVTDDICYNDVYLKNVRITLIHNSAEFKEKYCNKDNMTSILKIKYNIDENINNSEIPKYYKGTLILPAVKGARHKDIINTKTVFSTYNGKLPIFLLSDKFVAIDIKNGKLFYK